MSEHYTLYKNKKFNLLDNAIYLKLKFPFNGSNYVAQFAQVIDTTRHFVPGHVSFALQQSYGQVQSDVPLVINRLVIVTG